MVVLKVLYPLTHTHSLSLSLFDLPYYLCPHPNKPVKQNKTLTHQSNFMKSQVKIPEFNQTRISIIVEVVTAAATRG